MNQAHLPKGFEPLEPFVEKWVASRSAERERLRSESSEAEREAFFNGMKDFAPPALDLLDKKPLDQFDDKEQCLMNLLMSFAHVAMAVEIHGKCEPQHAKFRQRMIISRSATDRG